MGPWPAFSCRVWGDLPCLSHFRSPAPRLTAHSSTPASFARAAYLCVLLTVHFCYLICLAVQKLNQKAEGHPGCTSGPFLSFWGCWWSWWSWAYDWCWLQNWGPITAGSHSVTQEQQPRGRREVRLLTLHLPTMLKPWGWTTAAIKHSPQPASAPPIPLCFLSSPSLPHLASRTHHGTSPIPFSRLAGPSTTDMAPPPPTCSRLCSALGKSLQEGAMARGASWRGAPAAGQGDHAQPSPNDEAKQMSIAAA